MNKRELYLIGVAIIWWIVAFIVVYNLLFSSPASKVIKEEPLISYHYDASTESDSIYCGFGPV